MISGYIAYRASRDAADSALSAKYAQDQVDEALQIAARAEALLAASNSREDNRDELEAAKQAAGFLVHKWVRSAKTMGPDARSRDCRRLQHYRWTVKLESQADLLAAQEAPSHEEIAFVDPTPALGQEVTIFVKNPMFGQR